MISWLYRLADAARHRSRRCAAPVEQANGHRGEDLAHRHLRSLGFTIVARNYRPRSGAGEIDLIAWDGDTLVFVEVKSRTSEEFGSPDRAVDPEKQRFVERAARDYMRRSGVVWDRARFDIVNVYLTHPERVSLIKDAFRLSRTI